MLSSYSCSVGIIKSSIHITNAYGYIYSINDYLTKPFISRLCEKCHPASTLLAVITYTSVNTKKVRDQSPILKLLDQMVLRVKARLTQSLHEICILPTDIEKIQLRLQRRIPAIIATDVNLCLYTMKHIIEVPIGREEE